MKQKTLVASTAPDFTKQNTLRMQDAKDYYSSSTDSPYTKKKASRKQNGDFN